MAMERSCLRTRLEKRPNTLRRDIHLVTRILLKELETVLPGKDCDACAADNDNAQIRGVLLQRVAVEVDCIGMTRNVLQHGNVVSARKLLRCLQSSECLWHRMEPEEVPSHALKILQKTYG